MPDDSAPITVFAQFRVRAGSEDEFLAIASRHWPTLHELGFVTDKAPRFYVGFEKGIEGPFMIEVFEWVDPDASRRAATHPEVSSIWEAMGPLCESRAGRPSFEFPNLREIDLP